MGFAITLSACGKQVWSTAAAAPADGADPAAEADVLVAVRMPRPSDPRGLRLRVRFEPLQ